MKQFNVVYLDETQYWNIPEAFKGIKVFGVYVYCPRERTHVCELTPSYELWFVHSVADGEVKQAISDRNEFTTSEERLADFLNEGDIDTEPVRYFHCSVIDRVKNERHKTIGEFETADDAVEYAQGNCW